SDGTYEALTNSNVITINHGSNLIEAEQFNRSSGSISTQNYANQTGSGRLVAYLSSPSAFLEYHVNVLVQGTYKLKFRMANGGSTALDVWNVLIGGINQNVTI